MSATEFAIEHLGDFFEYNSYSKIKELVKSNVSKFYTFDSTDKYLRNYSIKGVELFSKKEKNAFVEALQDNPYADYILKEYNKSYTYGGREKTEVLDLFKNLKTLSKFLQVMPYSEPSFCLTAYKEVINWGLSKNEGDFQTLITAFNNYSETALLKQVFSKDINEKSNAIEEIKERALVKVEIEKKDTVITSMAGIISIGLVGVLGGANELSGIVIPKVLGLVGTTMLAPTLVSMAHVGVGLFAFYKTFQILNQAFQKVGENERKKQVRYADPTCMTSMKDMCSVIRNDLFKDVLISRTIDINKKENERYIDLLLFVSEKLENSHLTVSEKMINNNNFSELEINNLNNLTAQRIHEISNIKHPEIREMFILSTISNTNESFYKKVNNANQLFGGKDIYTDNLEENYIINLDSALRQKIEYLEKSDKKMAITFLKLFTDDTGKCRQDVIDGLENCISLNGNFKETLSRKLHEEIVACKKLEIKNKEIDYAGKVVKFVTGSKGEEYVLPKANKDVRSLILERSLEYSYNETEEVVKRNPPWTEKLYTKTIDIMCKIGELRDKMKKEGLGLITVRP
jgi:hypothetical protein